IPHDDNSNNVIDYFTADILNAYDYYSFGSPMPERSLYAKEANCYWQDYTLTQGWVTDGQLSTWLSYNGGSVSYNPSYNGQEVSISGSSGDGASYWFTPAPPSATSPGVTVTNSYSVDLTVEATYGDGYVAVYDGS